MPPTILKNLANLFSLILALFFYANQNYAMERLSEGRSYRNEDNINRKKKHQGKKKKNIYDANELATRRNKKLLKETFENLDYLFTKITVRVTNRNTKEVYETLFSDFIKGSSDIDYILGVLQRETGLSKKDILSVNDESKKMYFTDFVDELWKNKFIRRKLANNIIFKYKVISDSEILKLFENGASHLSSNILLEIKCGDQYGNLIDVEERMFTNSAKFEEIRNIAVATHLIGANEDIRDYLDDPRYIENLINISGANGVLLLNTWNVGSVVDYIRKNFLLNTLINSTTWFSPMAAAAASAVNPIDSFNTIVAPSRLTAVIMGNHYFADSNSSLTSALSFTPLGANLSTTLNFPNYSMYGFLTSYDRFIMMGGSLTKDFPATGTDLTQTQTFFSVGGTIGGWSNMLQLGANFQTLLADGTGIGASATVTLTRSHNLIYHKQEPLDGPIPAIRGMHKVEIDDLRGISAAVGVSVSGNQAMVPITAAFRATGNYVRKKIFRTHVSVGRAQEMLSEEAVPGLLYLFGKKIKYTKIPDFDHPEDLLEGDELIQVKTGSLLGAFVLGLASLSPVYATRFGGSIEMIGEYELGLKKLPNNKYEVSIEPVKVLELSLFESMLTIIGAGLVHRCAMAKKQIFLFDFNNPLAKDAYDKLIEQGIVPGARKIAIYNRDKGAEYLLSEFRAQNKKLAEIGVSRIFLEQVDVDANKLYAGLNAPIFSGAINIAEILDKKIRKSKKKIKLVFDFFEFEHMRAESTSLLTNGIIAVIKKTTALKKARAQGFSGKYSKELFITNKTIHTIKDLPDNSGENKWNFHSMSLTAVYNDTVITGQQENKIVDRINRKFLTKIDDFKLKNTRVPRIITVKREIDKTDLFHLTSPKSFRRIDLASNISGIKKFDLYELLQELEDKHPHYQAEKLKNFISHYGIKGFAAVHHLLDSDLEKLFLSSQSSYGATVAKAQKFVLKYSNPDREDNEKNVLFDASNTKENKKNIKEFYEELRVHIRDIDRHLRLLYDDQYFVDENSTLYKDLGKEKFEKLIASGARQNKSVIKNGLISVRKAVLSLIDYEKQGFSEQEIYFILKNAKKSDLRLAEEAKLAKLKYGKSISKKMSKNEIKKRFKEVWYYNHLIEVRLKKIDEDKILMIMDPDYITYYKKELRKVQDELNEIVSLEHLEAAETLKIQKRFQHDKPRFERFDKFRKNRNEDLRIESVFRAKSIEHNANDNLEHDSSRAKSFLHGNSFLKKTNFDDYYETSSEEYP